MALLKNVQMHWVKLDPKRPAPAFGDSGPKWEFEARTTSKAQMEEWKKLNINVKPVADDDGNRLYWRTKFQKKTEKKDGDPQEPVNVVNGSLEKIDPNTIGNGSVCNIRIFQYEYEVKSEKAGGPSKKGVATMLMSVQVTKLVKYEAKPRDDDFEMEEMEVVEIADNQQNDPNADDSVVVEKATPAKASADPNF